MSESIYQLFEETAHKYTNKPAIKYFCNNKEKWITKSWKDLQNDVNNLLDTS